MSARKIVCTLSFVAAIAFCVVPAQADLVWDATSGFISGTTNGQTQSGTELWQYFSVPKDNEGQNGPYTLTTWKASDAAWNTGGVYAWVDAAGLWLYPSNGNPNTSAVGWNCPIPSGGTVDVSFSIGGDTNATGNGCTYALWKSGDTTALASGTVPNLGSSGTITVTGIPVSTGTMLYLQEGPNGPAQASGDDYQATFVITQHTPEPGTLVLLVCGLISLMAYAWRKHK